MCVYTIIILYTDMCTPLSFLFFKPVCECVLSVKLVIQVFLAIQHQGVLLCVSATASRNNRHTQQTTQMTSPADQTQARSHLLTS